MATTPNYAVNYEDDRFKQVEADKTAKINETNTMYSEMVNSSDGYYQAQIDASKDWANKQQEIQQANTDFAVEKINQQKDQAYKDYTKEQKGAYTDYQKEVNAYGANAEQMAANGLQNSGYSESSRVSLYNTYQNRYATAKDSYNRAVLNYDNSIKEAQLANNSALAEISYKALQSQLELSLQGFQYKNNLLLQQADAINKVEDTYYNRYQNVLAQINQENSMAEQVRQYNEKMAEERRQYNETMAFQKDQAKQEQKNWEKQYALSKKAASSSGGSTKKATLTNNTKKAQITDNKKTEKVDQKKMKSIEASISAMKVPSTMGKMLGISGVDKSAQKSYISLVYKQGKINNAELDYLAQKYGL
jgi:hypothetical protein